MRIGIVTYWFNRGQATIGRHLRDALGDLGHDTYVLARPALERTWWAGLVDQDDDDWAQPQVSRASAYDIPAGEYEEWARRHDLDVVFCFQNYQFAEIAQLRNAGFCTIGCFMWETLGEDEARQALGSFDATYALTRCSHERFNHLGLPAVYVPWGCHPETIRDRSIDNRSTVTFFFPVGYLGGGRRKPLELVVEAFTRVLDPRLRLLIKAQAVKPADDVVERTRQADARIEVHEGDVSARTYGDLFASADVCVAPSRWEGLGLHLFEATALGMPIITTDAPPMSEIVHHERNGLLVSSRRAERRRSGIYAYDPDVNELADAFERLADDRTRNELAAGARARRAELPWSMTQDALAVLVEHARTQRRVRRLP